MSFIKTGIIKKKIKEPSIQLLKVVENKSNGI